MFQTSYASQLLLVLLILLILIRTFDDGENQKQRGPKGIQKGAEQEPKKILKRGTDQLPPPPWTNVTRERLVHYLADNTEKMITNLQ